MLYSAKLSFCVAIAIQMCIICVWIFFYKRNFQMCGRQYGEIATLTKTEGRLTTCPLIPIGLVGSITVNKTDPQTWTTIEQKYSVIKDGGFVPENCTSRQRVTILVPFRDRESHLRIFLNHMHAFLMKQQLEYAIYVIEQSKDFEFNRGFLFNVGFKEALKDSDYDCFVFHDVDLLPENDHNIYTCPVDQPKHLSVILENWDYKLPYDANFGGVSAMTKEQYEAVNGFSNSFFGWGGEDDDFYNRVVWANMSIYRAITGVGRYSSLQHVTATENPARYKILSKGKEQMWKDGLSSLNYIIIQKKTKKLFNHIIVKTI
ncbi:beta-1,4-N-acetylgalactosaminyltransferase bre-4-like isoform X1 [Crassostrea angulata]|uniref:beta-1,4-N-acetylgalactosaminyltransferase bre-4-like isoform X1 n=1 Tax=Magallana angulata TaxID=2784310 RepID=UPI0022B169AD|nr:beta-1,4-N-acetylgalactosaminyltransferase bre-4-like isoform X1 [Crassostrea angulata]